MKKVADILSRKGTAIESVRPDTTVLDALRLMAEKNIGSVVVMDNNRFLGIITELDYSRKVALKGKSSTDTKVDEIMSVDFPSVSPRDSIELCMQLLSEKNIRYLPVFEEDKMVGILSINDIVKQTILAQEETITSLKEYMGTNM
jgi:CBS domain-containing protein